VPTASAHAPGPAAAAAFGSKQPTAFAMDTRTLHWDAVGRSSLAAASEATIATTTTSRRVVVDVREFRSSLPSFLHGSGHFQLDACTLLVGDFVLSPRLCVERKSISDLFGSLRSGRLFNQAEAMSRHYATPALLVEFSSERAFLLQTAADIRDAIDPQNICSKLALLALAFPQLRILWSRDARHTVDLFAALKAGQPEPDANAAMAMGVAADASGLGAQAVAAGAQAVAGSSGELGALSSNDAVLAAEEMLQRLPGITVHNYRRVLAECGSLSELFRMTEAQLTPLLGNAPDAKRLHKFVNQLAPL
jgi:DNA excision repair protein ERCC-4